MARQLPLPGHFYWVLSQAVKGENSGLDFFNGCFDLGQHYFLLMLGNKQFPIVQTPLPFGAFEHDSAYP
jgi:hypothetical protein